MKKIILLLFFISYVCTQAENIFYREIEQEDANSCTHNMCLYLNEDSSYVWFTEFKIDTCIRENYNVMPYGWYHMDNQLVVVSYGKFQKNKNSLILIETDTNVKHRFEILDDNKIQCKNSFYLFQNKIFEISTPDKFPIIKTGDTLMIKYAPDIDFTPFPLTTKTDRVERNYNWHDDNPTTRVYELYYATNHKDYYGTVVMTLKITDNTYKLYCCGDNFLISEGYVSKPEKYLYDDNIEVTNIYLYDIHTHAEMFLNGYYGGVDGQKPQYNLMLMQAPSFIQFIRARTLHYFIEVQK